MKHKPYSLALFLIFSILSSCDVSLSKFAQFQILIDVDSDLQKITTMTNDQVMTRDQTVNLYQNSDLIVSKRYMQKPAFFDQLRLKGDVFAYAQSFFMPIFSLDYENIEQIDQTFAYHLNFLSVLPSLWLDSSFVLNPSLISDQDKERTQKNYSDFLTAWQTFLGTDPFFKDQVKLDAFFSISAQSTVFEKDDFHPKSLRNPNQFAFWLHTKILDLLKNDEDLKQKWLDLFQKMNQVQNQQIQRDQWFKQVFQQLSQSLAQIQISDPIQVENQQIFKQEEEGEWLWLKNWLICPRSDLSVFFAKEIAQQANLDQWQLLSKSFQCDSANLKPWALPIILTPTTDEKKVQTGQWFLEGDLLSTDESIQKIDFEIQWQARDWMPITGLLQTPTIISQGQKHHYRIAINSDDFQNENIQIKVIARTENLEVFKIFHYETKSMLIPKVYRFDLQASLANEVFEQVEVFEWDQGIKQRIKVQNFAQTDQSTSIEISTNQRYLTLKAKTKNQKFVHVLIDTTQLVGEKPTIRLTRYQEMAYQWTIAKLDQWDEMIEGDSNLLFNKYFEYLSDTQWGELPIQADFQTREWQFWENCFAQSIEANTQLSENPPLPYTWTKGLYQGCLKQAQSLQMTNQSSEDQTSSQNSRSFERQMLSKLYTGAILWEKINAHPNLCDLNQPLNESCLIAQWETQALATMPYAENQKPFDWQSRLLWLQTDLHFKIKIKDRMPINQLKLSFRNQNQICIKIDHQITEIPMGEDLVETDFQCQTAIFKDAQGMIIEIDDDDLNEQLILEVQDLFERKFQKYVPLKRSHPSLFNQIQIIAPNHCRPTSQLMPAPNTWSFYCGQHAEDFSIFYLSPKVYDHLLPTPSWTAQISENVIQSLSYDIPQDDGIDSQILSLTNPLNQNYEMNLTIYTDRQKPILRLLDMEILDEFAFNADRNIASIPTISLSGQSSDMPNDQIWYLAKWFHWVNSNQPTLCRQQAVNQMPNCQSLLTCSDILSPECETLRNDMTLKWHINDQNLGSHFHLNILKKNLLDQSQTILIDEEIETNSFELTLSQILDSMLSQSLITEYFQLEAVVTDLAGNSSFPLQQTIQFKPILPPLNIQTIPSQSPNLTDLQDDLSLFKNPIILHTYRIKSNHPVDLMMSFKSPSNLDLQMQFDLSERIVNTNGQLQLNSDCFGPNPPWQTNRFLKEPSIQLNVISLGTCMDIIQREPRFTQAILPKFKVTRNNEMPQIFLNDQWLLPLAPFEEIQLEILADWPLNEEIETLLESRSFNYPYAVDLQGSIGLFYDENRDFLYGWRIWFLHQAQISLENQPFLQVVHPFNREVDRNQVLDGNHQIQTDWQWQFE
jgi:hypothetical protein